MQVWGNSGQATRKNFPVLSLSLILQGRFPVCLEVKKVKSPWFTRMALKQNKNKNLYLLLHLSNILELSEKKGNPVVEALTNLPSGPNLMYFHFRPAFSFPLQPANSLSNWGLTLSS